MIIECIRCGKKYNKKETFEHHLDKRGLCITDCIEIPKKIYRKDYKDLNNLFEDKYKNLISIQNHPVKFGCDKCGNLYNSQSYYFRHKKGHCMFRNEAQIEITTINENNSQNPISGNNQQLNNSQNSISGNNQHQSQTQSQSQNVNQSRDVAMPHSNNHSGNITINNYGTIIDVTTLPLDVKQRIISNPKEAISDMCETVWINMPENRNVYIKDLKDGYGMIFKDGKWNAISMDKLLSELVENSADYVYDIVQDETCPKNTRLIHKLDRYFENVSELGHIGKYEKRNVRNIVYNGRAIIRKHFEEFLNRKVKLNLHPI